jgi:hypothetical protein
MKLQVKFYLILVMDISIVDEEIFTCTSIRGVWIPAVPCIAPAGIACSTWCVDASTHTVAVLQFQVVGPGLIACAEPNCPIQNHPVVNSWRQHAFQRPLPTVCATLEDLVILVKEEGSAASVILIVSDLP